jgi:tetraacyldisaccharide 4'-kinase
VTLRPPSPPRSPWQRLYGAAHRLRRRRWARQARRVALPVVSVGNLSWGGSGKTPLVAAIAAWLRDHGRRVAVLSRGYKSGSRGVRVVSTGEGPLLGPSVAGDEPVLLAGELPGVAVVVGPDRAEAARHALERLDPRPQVLLLDDGFSHLRLFRDLDLLAFPASDPFAGARLPPSGRLREPLASARHADAVLLTGASGETGEGEALAEALRPYGFRGPGFACRSRVGPPRRVGPGGELPPGSRVLLVAGIARPEAFFEAARAQAIAVAAALAFADHHAYPAEAIEEIERAAAAAKAEAVLVTGKDRVKLQGRLRPPLYELPLTAEPEPAFWAWFEERLREITARHAGAGR